MLKETEAEETTVFFVTFLSWVAFQLGAPLGPPPCYAYDLSSLTVASKKKKSCKLTLPVNFYYLFTKSDLKVKSNMVLNIGVARIFDWGGPYQWQI